MGFRSADSSASLSLQLADQDLILLDCKAQLTLFGRSLRPRGRIGKKDLRDFTLHMATCLSSGIPIVQALRDIEKGMAGKPLGGIIIELREEISSGSRVAEALAHHPEAFSDMYISLASAGESSGNLDVIFEELVNYLEWSDDLAGKVHQAMVYPALLAAAVLGLFLLMLTVVIPRFMSVFTDLDYELPVLTRRVLALGDAFSTWWPAMLGGLIALFVGHLVMKRSVWGRHKLDRLIFEAPVVGDFVQRLILSRFSKNFVMLFGAGVDIVRVLEMLEGIVGNSYIARQIADARERVMTGETLGEAFNRCSGFPPLVKRLIIVGENTGSLDRTLGKAAEYLDKEIPRKLKQVFTVAEVGIIVLLGGMVAISALAMLLPIFSVQSQMIK